MSNEWITSRRQDGVLIVERTDGAPFCTLSSAILGGGLQQKRHLLNAQVAHGYLCDDPWRDLELRVERMGLPVEDVVAMMTAADVDRMVTGQAEGEQFRLQVYVTAGVGNAARAGTARRTYPGYVPGTINIIAAIDGRVAESAMVNAVQTITEAKTAALQDLGVPDVSHRDLIATGTTTDAVTVAVTQNEKYTGVHQYAGLATELGEALAVQVHRCVRQALQRWRDHFDEVTQYVD